MRAGRVVVNNEGAVLVSVVLDAVRETLGLDEPTGVHALHEGHRGYMPWHRVRVFKHGGQHG